MFYFLNNNYYNAVMVAANFYSCKTLSQVIFTVAVKFTDIVMTISIILGQLLSIYTCIFMISRSKQVKGQCKSQCHASAT